MNSGRHFSKDAVVSSQADGDTHPGALRRECHVVTGGDDRSGSMNGLPADVAPGRAGRASNALRHFKNVRRFMMQPP